MGACGSKKKKENADTIFVNLKDGLMVTDDRFQISKKETVIDIRRRIFNLMKQSTFKKRITFNGIEVDDGTSIGTIANLRNGSTITLVEREAHPSYEVKIKLENGGKELHSKGLYSFSYIFNLKELIFLSDKYLVENQIIVYNDQPLEDLETFEKLKIPEGSQMLLKIKQ